MSVPLRISFNALLFYSAALMPLCRDCRNTCEMTLGFNIISGVLWKKQLPLAHPCYIRREGGMLDLR